MTLLIHSLTGLKDTIMFNTKIAIIALSAMTAATTVNSIESFREQDPADRRHVAIPLQPVGDTVKVNVDYSPAMHCKTLRADMDIDIISACAVRRVGWLKL